MQTFAGRYCSRSGENDVVFGRKSRKIQTDRFGIARGFYVVQLIDYLVFVRFYSGHLGAVGWALISGRQDDRARRERVEDIEFTTKSRGDWKLEPGRRARSAVWVNECFGLCPAPQTIEWCRSAISWEAVHEWQR